MIRRIILMMMVVGLCVTVPAAGADVFAMPGALISVEFVPVENIANTADSATTYGAVDYNYSMGKYEVTTAQYTEFLNAVAADDTYGLYNVYMNSEQVHPTFGIIASYECSSHIVQSGTAGSYTYSVAAEWANRPVTRVGWGDAARFTNWLHNGQPIGAQGVLTTEDGAYYLNGANDDAPLLLVSRELDAQYMLPTEDEWYKAAFHKNDGATGNYFLCATSTDTKPSNPSHWAWDWNATDPDTEMGPYNAASYIQGDYYPGRDGDDYWQSEVDFWDLSESPYGTLSQAGNVSEWTEAIGQTAFPYEDAYILRGANWDRGHAALVSAYRFAYVPTDDDPLDANKRHVGFRVAKAGGLDDGDFNDDGYTDGIDIDLMGDFIRNSTPYDAAFDFTGITHGVKDGVVTLADLDYLIRELVDTAMGVGTGSEYGDFNLDGLVDTTDLTRLATYFGPGTMWAEGNANRYLDLTINTTDLTILSTYFGFDASVDTIPEPATMSLLALGGPAVLRRRRK